MFPPDLGGGRRLRRRPRSFFTGIFFSFLLLSSSLPQAIPIQADSGDSDLSFWARRYAPLLFTASSTVRALSRSLPANANGSDRPIDLEPHLSLYPCRSGPAIYRSEAKGCLKFDFNPRSEPFLSLLLRFASVFNRFCSSIGKSEKSTNSFTPFPSQLVGRSKSLVSSNPTGDCKLSRRSSNQDRYNLPTPIILIINTKFIVDIGVLHGFNSVMEKDYLSSAINFRRVDLRSDYIYHHFSAFILNGRGIGLLNHQVDYRLSTALLTGPRVLVFFSSLSLEVYVDNLRCIEVAKSYKARNCGEKMPESYRRGEDAALRFVEKLGQTVSVGPVSTFHGLYYQKGFKTNIKTTQRKNYRTELGFNVIYRIYPVWCLKFVIFCIVGLTSRLESLDSVNFRM